MSGLCGNLGLTKDEPVGTATVVLSRLLKDGCLVRCSSSQGHPYSFAMRLDWAVRSNLLRRTHAAGELQHPFCLQAGNLMRTTAQW